MSTKKAASKRTSSGSGPKSKRIVKGKMKKVMHEYKHGELSRGRGGKVKNPKQAIAIGLSEARRSGANVPPKPGKKKAAKKASTKKSAAKKTATKKSAGKKTASKKTAARKR
jgi:hypothetical protein